MSKDSAPEPKVSLKRRFARFIAKLAVVAVIVVWGVQEAWGESHWFTVYVTYAPPIIYLTIPAGALLLAILCFDGRALIWGLVAAALCLLGVARPGLRLNPPGAPEGKTIRIVTWNIHGEIGEIPTIRAHLQELEPDIVCLQEANHRKFRECWPEANSTRADSLMILTRGEINGSKALHSSTDEGAMRAPLEAAVTLDEADVNVLNVHLYSHQLAAALTNPSREKARRLTQRAVEMRTAQVQTVLEWLDRQRATAIVTGDFNTPPRGRLYRRLTERATDTFAASGKGFGWTFPQRRPVLRIDYIWISKDIDPVACGPLDVGLSDHRPVVADVAVP